MNWEWLKGLFPALKSVNLRLLNNISVSLFSNNAKATYIVDSRTLNVNWNQLTEKEKQTILRRAPKLVNRGMPVLEEDFNSKADDYVAKIGESDNDELLNYFKEKIPLEDFPILKASLYLRSVLRNGGETRGLKEEISRRYGLRGRNISNLCSAGYFESWVRPAYEEMSKLPKFTPESFLKVYEEIVLNYPFALFVHHEMSGKDIEESISKKIDLMRKYGISEFNIHGIGGENVEKLKSY